MPEPDVVNPEKFTVISVLYNQNDFSISYGTWTPTGDQVIGMRWNEGLDGSGYPKTFGHPQWFVVSNDIARNILVGLLTNNDLSANEHRSILEILGTLHAVD